MTGVQTTVISKSLLLFFFNDTATTEIYTLSLHDALPISVGAAIKTRSLFGGGSVVFRLRLWSRAQQLRAKRQKLGAPAVGQKAEMSNAHEAFREDVQ